MVLPMPWTAKCDQFEIPFAAREGAPELVRLQAAGAFTPTAETRVLAASPARIDPRKLEESIHS
jgi:hypothetical protein